MVANNDRNGESLSKFVGPSSPFYLHPSDNPGVIISPVVLRGDNYDEWAKAMRTVFHAKNKIGFIEGKVTKPENEAPEIDLWWSVNSMLVAWVFNTVDPSLRSTITYMETVKELWDDLKERFSIDNGPQIYQIKSELANCKQHGQTVVAYYGKLKAMWDELGSYSKVPICTCGCRCGAAAELVKEREEEKIHQFLMGLDDDIFGTVCSNILSMEPIPNMNKVYSMIIQEDRHRSLARGKEEQPDVAQASQTSRDNKAASKDKTIVCNNCGRFGHEAKSCFQLIGYPDWWGDKPRGTLTGRGAGRGKGGGRGRGMAKPHAAQSSAGREVAANAAVTDGDRTGLSELNDEASHHLTGNLNVLIDTYDVAPCPVRLPNGAHAEAVKEGTVELGNNFKLLHDRISRTLISAGEQLDGVYVFKGVAPVHAYMTDGIGSCDLRHRRLEHPSYQMSTCILWCCIFFDNC
ncbi:PREDICTED: uncharacterized protein LOC104609904 [Nelumbo nucifera]|uniref:Uncharacterized protein LOC104609904 n=1 Tax=Nelumbo nucifera TaxID=4432 RepID=A0A1U8BE45_NELNU|nr:PREDICTED: uncharacterized protein LOC104609904 [Nelumbo nucifera]